MMKSPFPRLVFVTVLLLLLALLSSCRGSDAQADPGAGASVYIQNKGSDTIVNLALAWTERYQVEHPEVRISVTGGGSGTGIAGLLNGTVDIANASREIKPEEIAQAERNGIEPEEHVIARDAIAVIVHPQNPVGTMTLEDVARIFRGELNNWSELGGEDRPIVRVSRETNSGTHVYFLEEVVRLGSAENKSIFAADTLLLPSSEGIIAEVADNPNAIGYDGLGYVTDHVKMVAIAKQPGQEFVLPSIDTVNNGAYAISRDLYMYTDQNPKPVVRAYLEWILSPDAQDVVTALGFVPVK
jgi:phosphate transport system substrate-binding protein